MTEPDLRELAFIRTRLDEVRILLARQIDEIAGRLDAMLPPPPAGHGKKKSRAQYRRILAAAENQQEDRP